MDEAEYCDRVSIMVAGRIAALGTPSELKHEFRAASIDEVFLRLARPGEPEDGGPRTEDGDADARVADQLDGIAHGPPQE
jgi:ABC-type multidrug transport system ATPase subunit